MPCTLFIKLNSAATGNNCMIEDVVVMDDDVSCRNIFVQWLFIVAHLPVPAKKVCQYSFPCVSCSSFVADVTIGPSLEMEE